MWINANKPTIDLLFNANLSMDLLLTCGLMQINLSLDLLLLTCGVMQAFLLIYCF